MKRNKNNIKKIIKRKNDIYITSRKLNLKNNIILNKKNKDVNKNLTVKKNIIKLEKQENKKVKKTNNSIYMKNIYVDYDAIICIPTYNRYNKVVDILNEIYNQNTKYTFKVIILDDNSTDIRYKKLNFYFDNIIYMKNRVNQGKYLYWKTINTLFKESSKYKFHTLIEIDDDFKLHKNFINNIMDTFFDVKNSNNNYMAFYYHSFKGISDSRWGVKNWFDGGVAFDYNFLKLINFKLTPIPLSRWSLNENLSSGVWSQLSKKIESSGFLTYKFDHSLVEHIGNEDSKMNKNLRDKNPIYSNIKI